MCVFDLPETVLNVNCHFTALVSNVCYLGNFMEERTIFADKVSADLHIKKCMFVHCGASAQSRCFNLSPHRSSGYTIETVQVLRISCSIGPGAIKNVIST